MKIIYLFIHTITENNSLIINKYLSILFIIIIILNPLYTLNTHLCFEHQNYAHLQNEKLLKHLIIFSTENDHKFECSKYDCMNIKQKED